MPSNFKTYESQSRLLAAVVAASDVKLNFKGKPQQRLESLPGVLPSLPPAGLSVGGRPLMTS